MTSGIIANGTMAGVSALIPMLPTYSDNLGESWSDFVTKFEPICKVYGLNYAHMAAMLPLALRDKALADYDAIEKKPKEGDGVRTWSEWKEELENMLERRDDIGTDDPDGRKMKPGECVSLIGRASCRERV